MPDEVPPGLFGHHAALLQRAKYLLPRSRWLRAKLDPDFVQPPPAEAVEAADRLTGLPDYKVLGYLRQALANNLTDSRPATPRRASGPVGTNGSSSSRRR